MVKEREIELSSNSKLDRGRAKHSALRFPSIQSERRKAMGSLSSE